MNLTIKPAASKDANNHFEIFDSCHDFLFGLLLVLSMVDKKQMDNHDNETICTALNDYAELGLLLLSAMYEPVFEIDKQLAAQKEDASDE